ncbi:hypothetical protein NEMIN01_2175 [Nematocida minor]|uniref:uncharacterized protein n=1 Tax=Nematocida minor TaxID=1912983 RepID=UPI00221FB589|nr:uncharacterized protein NEMIN01_2175 [Nematocida minor]KAI5192718.1 hypothetical protein NEMIN01_2175 [Nematocida minor]
MKNHKTKKILNIFVMLLSLYIRKCRGGSNFSSEETTDDSMQGGGNVSGEETTDDSMQGGNSVSSEETTDDSMQGESRLGYSFANQGRNNSNSQQSTLPLDPVESIFDKSKRTNQVSVLEHIIDPRIDHIKVKESWDKLPPEIEDMTKQYLLPQEDEEINKPSENTGDRIDSASSPQRAEKRKADKMSNSNDELDLDVLKKTKKESVEKIMKQYGIIRWNEKRFKNITRDKYRMSYTILTETTYRKNLLINAVKSKTYQTNLKREILDFAKNISPLAKHDRLYHFIASRTTNLYMKYKDLLGLEELFKHKENKKYIDIVKNFSGYYPKVFEDLISYIEKHMPLRINKDRPPTEWKRSFGDIYMSEYLEMNYSIVVKQKVISQIDKEYHALVHAMHMIIMLPEVYKDFSKIDEKFIEDTPVSMKMAENKKSRDILLIIKKVVQMYKKEKIDNNVYKDLYTALKDVQRKKELEKTTAVELYKEIYTLLGKFYEKAKVADVKNKYILAGKCIIRNQKYMKGEIKIDMKQTDASKRISIQDYSFEEENRWNVSPIVHTHYHVYYIDNLLGQPRKLCMPIFKGKKDKKEHYLHTISDIVKYIKKLYGIEESLNAIHPFKVNKKDRKWSRIEGKEKDKTVKYFVRCEIVFYYSEEDLSTIEFTFAQFLPGKPYGKGKKIISIPLFLSPLMQHAMDLGPFNEKEGKEHKKLKFMNFEAVSPDVYEFNKKYKKNIYSDIASYYRNLCILPDKISTECYIMDCQFIDQNDGTTKVEWYVRVPGDIDEYMHCVPNEEFKEKNASKEFNAFIAAIESRNYNKGSIMQGFWLSNNCTESNKSNMQSFSINSFLTSRRAEYRKNRSIEDIDLEIIRKENEKNKIEIEENNLKLSNTNSDKENKKRSRLSSQKSKIKESLKYLYEEKRIKMSKSPNNLETEIVVFRNLNLSKSNLGAHNEILDVFITLYRHKRGKNQ